VTVKADISFRVPASLSTEDVFDLLFRSDSGLVHSAETPAVDSDLSSEFDTWVSIGTLIISAAQAPLTLAQLVELVRQRQRRTDSADAPSPNARATHATPPVEINITVEGARYNIAELTPEQIRRLLEP
jgi:replication fork clamp-binding protein CrfC